MDATHLLQQPDSSPFEDMKQDMKRHMGNYVDLLEVKLAMPIDHDPIQWSTSWSKSQIDKRNKT